MPRLSLLERAALEAFAAGVRAELGPRLARLALFGSRARGEGRDDSDLDIAVVVHDLTREDRRFVQDLGCDVGIAHGLVLSPLIADEAAFGDELPIARAVAAEGVLL